MPQKKRSKLGLSMEVELTEKQEDFAKKMMADDTKLVFLSGSCGTGKTFLAMYIALCLLNKGQYDKILYLRTPIETGKSLGALKGELTDKKRPYLEVCKEKLNELASPLEVTRLIKEDYIDADVINYIRGKSISDTIIIFDEASNATAHEIETVIGRMNKNTRIFMCGDSRQADIKNPQYDKICALFEDQESNDMGIYNFKFTKEDIMRDPVIGYVLDKLDTLC